MTAPSLLDELEEVVRLAEKATPGPWLYRPKSNSWHKPPQQGTVYSYGEHIVGMDSDDEADNGWDEAFLIAAVQFMTAHHAELADMANELRVARESLKRCDEICKCTAEGWRTAEEDMAKRLEAAERDAARYRWLRNQATAGVMTTPCHGSLNCDEPESEWDAWIDAAAQEGEG